MIEVGLQNEDAISIVDASFFLPGDVLLVDHAVKLFDQGHFIHISLLLFFELERSKDGHRIFDEYFGKSVSKQ